MAAKEWNPRYLAYCRAHGQMPEDMLEADRKRYPGGCMAGYILWDTDRLREFRALRPECFTFMALTDHAAYDAWLQDHVERVQHGIS